MSEYTSKEVCEFTGVTYRRLSHWATHGVLTPSIKPPKGTGSRSIYSETDIVVVALMKEITMYLGNLTLPMMRTLVGSIREIVEKSPDVPEVMTIRFWRPNELIVIDSIPPLTGQIRPYLFISPSLIMQRLRNAQEFKPNR